MLARGLGFTPARVARVGRVAKILAKLAIFSIFQPNLGVLASGGGVYLKIPPFLRSPRHDTTQGPAGRAERE